LSRRIVVWFMSVRMVLAVMLIPKRLRKCICDALEAETARLRWEQAQAATTYRTPKGRLLTDDDIQALADEAERGYDVRHLRSVNTPEGGDPEGYH
jgi:hypothetical protein